MLVSEKAQPLRLFNCLLLHAHKDDESDDEACTMHKSAASTSPVTDPIAAATAVGATRLYFTEGGPSASLAALQRYLKVEEAHITCPLLRVLQLAPQAPTGNMQPLVYVEQDTQNAVSLSDETQGRREAVLTTCSGVCTQETMPSRWYHAPVKAALCVFQELMRAPTTSAASEPAFWAFLERVVLYHARDFYRGAVQVELQCVFVPTFEDKQSTAYSVDVFGDYVDEEDQAQKCGAAAGKGRTAMKVCVKSTEAFEHVMAYLKTQCPLLEADFGSSHLVVYAKWSSRLSAARGSSHSQPPAADATGAVEQAACFVWLQDDAEGAGRDGVYADAALEALLDELTLAAASISTPSRAAAVLQEEGVSAFFEACCLTHTLKRMIRKNFQAVVRRQRPLFHWVISLPPYSRLSMSTTSAAVTAMRFRNNAAVSRAVWSVTEMLVHWQQLSDSAHALANEALKRSFGRASGPSLQIVSAPARVPRQRRAIQQSALYGDTFSGGSALDRQRGKVNVPHLYGADEGHGASISLSSTQRGSVLAASGLFHNLRSIKEDSFNSTSVLDAEDVFGSYPKLTTRVVKRLVQSQTSVHAAQ
ncbi:hypothetical protein, unknown function [Leishmania infantum JPCM5]|uniref:Uncharacterized protein n=2 Tax=Leishmania infantum TaxID=5671 RepID=A4HT12_LEIIN|nr:hypothetical protein, unknown function [Leishmania infantum JPCM5]CAC9447174.1 hypothetical_protein_-_conserved [Leishmania infantum]CAM65556.1 hypothetical protein, unknown function [Leishmania infantum JPCM5]SUZ39172.1 hypothetical_protein_-_conserved [Leishmania infantum]|eukprot:XP_001463203.1 hypothetical protein, unknown function [Leishmania infantum JPCM5]